MASPTGEPKARSGASVCSPSSTGPAWQAPMATIGLPWTSAGRNGAGGAVRRIAMRVTSSGTSAAKAPEQLAVAALIGLDPLAVRGDHIGRIQVVAGESQLALQPSDPSPEGEPRDAGR